MKKADKVLKKLVANGFEITKLSNGNYMCYDNGKFNFAEDEGMFEIDEETLFQIYEDYLG